MNLIDAIMNRLFRQYEKGIVNKTIERCAQVCDKNAKDADEMYYLLHGLVSHPDTDMGVLKYACYNGQAGRDANDIRKLRHG